jgi:hypothetical protein
MKENQEDSRNRPTEKGDGNDPFLRDQFTPKRGVNTISKGKSDEDNEHLTETAKDDFRTNDEENKNADPSFDEIKDN